MDKEKAQVTKEEKTEENRPLDDSEIEDIVGGVARPGGGYDHYYKLPDGSGSGFGE